MKPKIDKRRREWKEGYALGLATGRVQGRLATMNMLTSSGKAAGLFSAFIRAAYPGVHGMYVGACGHYASHGPTCASCLADRLLKEHGIDVTTPQWSRNENGQIRPNWHPNFPDMNKEEEA